MTVSPELEVVDMRLGLPGQPDLFPDLNLVELARGWEPPARRGEFTGSTLGKDEQLCHQVCEAVLLGHSTRKIARACGISRNSVKAIMGVLEERGKIEPVKRRLSGKLAGVAEACVDHLLEGAEDGAIPYNVAAIAMGIALDKKALLDAEPASVVVGEVQEDLRIESVNKLIAGLASVPGLALPTLGPVQAAESGNNKASDSESDVEGGKHE
jgi:hypothetical protein